MEKLPLTSTDDRPAECIGQIFKARENCFINGRGEVCWSRRFTPLKRKSCPGCDSCGWVDEMLNETVYGCEEIPHCDDFKSGELYYLHCHVNYDHNGECDVELEFKKLKGGI